MTNKHSIKKTVIALSIILVSSISIVGNGFLWLVYYILSPIRIAVNYTDELRDYLYKEKLLKL